MAAPRAPEPSAPARPRTAEVPARTGPALRPNLPANRPAPPVMELSDDDKTPPPTRNPFAAEADDGLGAPPDEPSVQVSADLLAEDLDATQGRGIPPPRPARPSTPPPRPAAQPTGSRPAVAAPRRPAPPAPARPPPPVPSEDLVDDDAPRELDNSEKTHIKPIPEKPRR
jgi:pilus assembly protein CpaF